MMKQAVLFLGTAMVALSAVSAPTVLAQSNTVEKRVEKLEREMRAVQRTVFPGGSPTFFEGEISPSNNAVPPRATTGADTPVIQLTSRVDALEAQLQALTGQSEQNAFKIRELEAAFNAYKAQAEARAAAAPSVSSEVSGLVPPPVTRTQTTPATSPAKPSTATTSGGADAARLARVRQIDVPATGNDVEDGYNYGYRLWEAKLYPEAQSQLKEVVTKWPNHRLASFAQNLLGRAYLDEGKPSLAAVAFYNNYKDRPDGARAPHSLMYMGVSLTNLGRKADACKAFAELQDVYGSRMPQDVRNDANAAKSKAGC
jgi:TolA-binding protein